MSEAQKPVEETPVAVPTETPVEPAAATEVPAPEAPAETSAETTEATPAAEATTEEAAKEVTPATDGVLGHKAPGLVKSLRFSKRFFYFSEEPVEAKNLEKATVTHSTAAWATQTGKGLLFFAKRAEDKATPAGIFNLSEVTDVNKEGSNEFSFKVSGHKHTFQANNSAERDSWLAALTAKTAEAEAEKETVTSSEGYKAELEKFSKPATAVAAAKAAPEKAKEAVKDETPSEDKEDKKEEKKDAKSRSQSRKRASIFGTILGKKDAEEKKEAKEETPAEAATTDAPAEPAAATEASAEPAATSAETPAAETTEDKKEEVKRPDAIKAKRASIFGNFFQKVTSPTHEKSEKETTVSSTAPQLDNPVDESAAKPIEPESVTAPATESGEASATPAAETTATSPSSKGIFSFGKDKGEKKDEASEAKEKRRTSLFGTLGKKDKTSDSEATDNEAKPKSNKLGGLFRKPSKAVKPEEKKDKETAPETEAIPEGDKPEPISKDAPSEETPAETAPADKAGPEPTPTENVNVASTAAPVQAAA